jgi:hypothetical protein
VLGDMSTTGAPPADIKAVPSKAGFLGELLMTPMVDFLFADRYNVSLTAGFKVRGAGFRPAIFLRRRCQ